jgi:uncharacterized cupredoxin-like copper-binding protein
MKLTDFTTCAVLLVLGGTPAGAGSGPTGHGHDVVGFSAGEPGDAKKPARIVRVTMQERDEKMLFIPERIEVHKGEQIKFVLSNSGELDHEFVLATTPENLEHAVAMQRSPEMRHVDPNARRLASKQTSEIVWKFTKAGQFEFACLIPGHREAGMFGTVDVK